MGAGLGCAGLGLVGWRNWEGETLTFTLSERLAAPNVCQSPARSTAQRGWGWWDGETGLVGWRNWEMEGETGRNFFGVGVGGMEKLGDGGRNWKKLSERLAAPNVSARAQLGPLLNGVGVGGMEKLGDGGRNWKKLLRGWGWWDGETGRWREKLEETSSGLGLVGWRNWEMEGETGRNFPSDWRHPTSLPEPSSVHCSTGLGLVGWRNWEMEGETGRNFFGVGVGGMEKLGDGRNWKKLSERLAAPNVSARAQLGPLLNGVGVGGMEKLGDGGRNWKKLLRGWGWWDGETGRWREKLEETFRAIGGTNKRLCQSALNY